MVDMLNLGMPDAGFGMLSASSMQDLVCGLHLVCRIGIWVAACTQNFLLQFCENASLLEMKLFFFCVRASPFCIYISFFANLSEPF